MANDSKWVDAGEALIYDTNKDSKPLKFKDGTPYHAGMMTVNIGGALVKVWVQVSKGLRQGTLQVRCSVPVDGPSANGTAPSVPAAQPSMAKKS